MKGTEAERFWAKVEKTDTCWLWTATKIRGGYGRFGSGNNKILAHRWAYEREVGAIPHGLVLDHLCRVRECVRPDHLEPVTQKENARRGETGLHMVKRTHCPQGHEYTPENTYREKSGRRCLRCKREVNRKHMNRVNAERRGTTACLDCGGVKKSHRSIMCRSCGCKAREARRAAMRGVA